VGQDNTDKTCINVSVSAQRPLRKNAHCLYFDNLNNGAVAANFPIFFEPKAMLLGTCSVVEQMRGHAFNFNFSICTLTSLSAALDMKRERKSDARIQLTIDL
jgi:hypothetical protein